MKIKVCGMREPENIKAISALPIDMMGFIFHPKSPRFVKDELAKKLNVSILKEDLKRVGVFVNAEMDAVLNRVHDFRLDFVQLHGNESPEYCRELLSVWQISTMRSAKLAKAFAVDDNFDFEETAPYTGRCAFFVFDAKGENPGGNGTAFDWSVLERYTGPTPFLLSGGIDPESVPELKKLNHPQLMGVDINSRFETAPGVKDVEKVTAFVQAFR